MAQLIPSVFTKVNKQGDYNWMIQQPKYGNTLFLYNENAIEFLTNSKRVGAGNAIIRPYRYKSPYPQAACLITGHSTRHGGYKNLSDYDAKKNIDLAIRDIEMLIENHEYDRIIYSSDGQDNLGTGIFIVSDDVKKYIMTELKKIINKKN